MKVLLVRPPAPNSLSFVKILDNEPLELEYLHTALQTAGYEDYIYDGLIEEASISDVIKREKPDLIALTGYITQERLMIRIAESAKNINSNIVTVIGGVHAQINYARFFSEHIDYILRSESPDVLVSLMQYLQGENMDISSLNGVCYRENESFKVNVLYQVSINSLPIPDRTFFYKNKQKYRYLDLTGVATVKTALSCPYGCNFCYCTCLGGGQYDARDLALVIEELVQLDAQNVQIVDDDFLLDRSRVLEFIRLVRERDIRKTFICYGRADFIAKNQYIVTELASIGFKYFLVGLEAASDTTLESFNKGTTLEVNKKCVEVINNTKAECIALMIAPIDATKEYFRHMYNWIVDNKLKYVTVSIFTPIPGTSLYDEYKDRLITHNMEDWDFLHLVIEPVNMSRAAFYREYYLLFLKLYNIAQKSGVYSFMNLRFYKNMLSDYLMRKARDSR